MERCNTHGRHIFTTLLNILLFNCSMLNRPKLDYPLQSMNPDKADNILNPVKNHNELSLIRKRTRPQTFLP